MKNLTKLNPYFISGFFMLFSTSSVNNSNNIKPAAVYVNAKHSKKQIMQENKGKSGVYR
jgi:hypothetical protein